MRADSSRTISQSRWVHPMTNARSLAEKPSLNHRSCYAQSPDVSILAGRKLIVNADDFGLSRGVTDGIIHAVRHGIVTSTSLLANMPASDYALARLRSLKLPTSVGIHFNLSQGRPLSKPEDVRTLVDSDGRFLGPQRVFQKALRFDFRQSEIHRELEAQCQFMLDRGFEPTHADLHHFPFPQVVAAAMSAARKMGIRRFRSYRNRVFVDQRLAGRRDLQLKCLFGNLRLLPKRCFYVALNRLASSWFGLQSPDIRLSEVRMITDPSVARHQAIQRMFACCPQGISEWVCHPGFPDRASDDDEAMALTRTADLEIVCSEETTQAIRGCGLELTSYLAV